MTVRRRPAARPLRDARAARPLDAALPSCAGPSDARPTACSPARPTASTTRRASATPSPEARAAVQHAPVPALRPDRHRRPAVARVARPEPRGDGLGVDHDRRPARLPRAAHRRRQGRQPALRRLPQGPRRRPLRLLRRREPGQEAHRLGLLRPRQRLRGRAVPQRHAARQPASSPPATSSSTPSSTPTTTPRTRG